MSPTWTVRRQPGPRRDGDRRWDQAYQLLVRWAAARRDTRRGPGHRRCVMRVALYARVSTTRQAQTQTIEQQLERLAAAGTGGAGPWTRRTCTAMTATAARA